MNTEKDLQFRPNSTLVENILNNTYITNRNRKTQQRLAICLERILCLRKYTLFVSISPKQVYWGKYICYTEYNIIKRHLCLSNLNIYWTYTIWHYCERWLFVTCKTFVCPTRIHTRTRRMSSYPLKCNAPKHPRTLMTRHINSCKCIWLLASSSVKRLLCLSNSFWWSNVIYIPYKV